MAPLTANMYSTHLWNALNGMGHALPDLFAINGPFVVNLFHGLHPQERYPNSTTSYAGVYKRMIRKEPWAEIATLHTQVVVAQLHRRSDPSVGLPPPPNEGDSVTACAKQHELVNALCRHLMSATEPTGWVVPTLLQVCKDLRSLAIAADEQLVQQGEKPRALEEASRLLQKCFSACSNDRYPSQLESRRSGTYYLATLLFKTYFKLKSPSLCKNIVRGINAAGLDAIFPLVPIGHRTTYTYYLGVFAFLREEYTEAETHFSKALGMVNHRATKNIERILSYLIPIMLLRGVLPTKRNMKKAGRFELIYRPFIDAYKSGNVQAYDRHLHYAEKRLMERGTYLVVERAREGAVRSLLKKAWILEGKPPRMSVADFRRYYIAGSGDDTVDSDEMECILANLIYKGFIKGYISHGHGIVVLSKDRPFPWAAPHTNLTPTARADRERREKENAQKVIVIPDKP